MECPLCHICIQPDVASFECKKGHNQCYNCYQRFMQACGACGHLSERTAQRLSVSNLTENVTKREEKWSEDDNNNLSSGSGSSIMINVRTGVLPGYNKIIRQYVEPCDSQQGPIYSSNNRRLGAKFSFQLIQTRNKNIPPTMRYPKSKPTKTLLPPPPPRPLKANRTYTVLEANADGLIDANYINLPRRPIKCPIYKCMKKFDAYNFIKHLLEHECLVKEFVDIGGSVSFELKPKDMKKDTTMCLAVCLLRNKVKNLCNYANEEVYPILVMANKALDVDLNTTLIWVTGIVAPEIPVKTSITVKSPTQKQFAETKICKIYDVTQPQNAKKVFSSNFPVRLSVNYVKAFTKHGKQPLIVTVTFL